MLGNEVDLKFDGDWDRTFRPSVSADSRYVSYSAGRLHGTPIIQPGCRCCLGKSLVQLSPVDYSTEMPKVMRWKLVVHDIVNMIKHILASNGSLSCQISIHSCGSEHAF